MELRGGLDSLFPKANCCAGMVAAGQDRLLKLPCIEELQWLNGKVVRPAAWPVCLYG
jgi:hypothetical protein